MPLRNGKPIIWRPRGVVDALDGTNAPEGAMASLSNLVPAPSTNFVWQPRPPAILLTSFSGLSSPGFVSGMLRIGNRIYGMIASALNSGHDQPFVYEILTNTFVSVSGITSANTPVSPATSGDWTPPVIFQAGSRIIVTHPGFPGGTVKFGWFDISGLNTTVVADEVSGSAVLTGSPNILGIQPGLAITGTGIPASTSIVLAANAFTAVSFTADSHSNFTLDSISPSAADWRAGFAIVGPGIPPGTTISSIQGAGQITLSQEATSSLTGATFYMLGPAVSPLNYVNVTLTAGSATVACADTTGIWVGQSVADGSGLGEIPPGCTVTAVVANTSFDISSPANVSGATGSLQFSGNVIIMSQNATATNNSITFAIAGGSVAAPQWGAGDTQPNNLPSTPLGGAQMNGRAYFACGTDGIPFSDSGFPCQISDTARVQALTTNDGLAVTAIGALTLASLLGGQVQSLIAFEGSSKMQQITGDLATYNLAMNSLPVATGTDAPNTITNCELGVAFVSPEGLRIIDFTGRVSPPIGDHGEGITVPFIYAVVPSRMCAAANADTIRITTQNGAKPDDPYEEYCYDLTRKAWYGPHTSTFSLIEPWADQFVATFIGTNAKLFSSTVIPVLTSDWVENGTQLVWQYEPVYLMPDNGEMAMNALVEMTITCGGPDCSSTAAPEAILYTPPPIGGPPLQPGPTPPGGTPVPPNTPPPPPGQPPPSFAVSAADLRFGGVWNFPTMADGALGTLSAWIYLDPAVFSGGIPDMFNVYSGLLSYVLAGPGTLGIYISESKFMTPLGMNAVAVKTISNSATATITFYGTTPLDDFPSLIGEQVNIQVLGNAGWGSGPGLKTVISQTPNTLTVNWDTSGNPAWVENTKFNDVTYVYIGTITISSATNAVVTCTVPHGISSSSVAAGQAYISINFTGSPGPPPSSGWDTVLSSQHIKILSSTGTTLTLDLNTTGFTAWTSPLQYQVDIPVLNTISIQLTENAWNYGPTDDTFFLFKKYLTPLPWSTWVNVIVAWDTNASAQGKSLSVSFGETVLIAVNTIDPCPAFVIPYSNAGSGTGLNSGPPSAPSMWSLFYQTRCYVSELWFDATVNLDPSVSANRYLFHSSTTGRPISLGATGNTPTGSAPTYYGSLTSDAITPPPALTFVDPNGNALVQLAATLGGLADSTSMVMSFWIDRNFLNWTNFTPICFGAGCTIFSDNTVTPAIMTVGLNDAIGGLFVFTFPLNVGTGANVRMSVDTNHGIGLKIVHVYIGTSSVSVTVTTDNTNNLSVTWQDGVTDFYAVDDVGGYIGDFWFGPGQLFDVSNKFVDGSGNPVDLGANGQLPNGMAPTCYFHCDSRDPATAFYANRGLGGAFTFQSGSSSVFVLQNGTRISDNRAGGNNLVASLTTVDTNYGTILLAPISPTD